MVDMESGAVLLLGPLDADSGCQHLVSPVSFLSGYYHCDGGPNMDIPAHMIVGLPPLGGKADGQALQRGL